MSLVTTLSVPLMHQSLHPRIGPEHLAMDAIVSFLDNESVVCLRHTASDLANTPIVAHRQVHAVDELLACTESFEAFETSRINAVVCSNAVLRLTQRNDLKLLAKLLDRVPRLFPPYAFYRNGPIDPKALITIFRSADFAMLRRLRRHNLFSRDAFAEYTDVPLTIEKIIHAAFKSRNTEVISQCLYGLFTESNFSKTTEYEYACIIDCLIKSPLIDERLAIDIEKRVNRSRGYVFPAESIYCDYNAPDIFKEALICRQWTTFARQLIDHARDFSKRTAYVAILITYDRERDVFPEFHTHEELAEYVVSRELGCAYNYPERPLETFLENLNPIGRPRHGDVIALSISRSTDATVLTPHHYRIARDLSFDQLLGHMCATSD